MNVFRKAWRRQVASRRARTIWWFRRGWAKLGCFKCGHDCYEIEGDTCPACGAPIDRDAPWWRAGKYPLWWALAVAFLGGALSWVGPIYDELTHTGASYPLGAPKPYETLREVAQFASVVLMFVALYLASRRGRWRKPLGAIRACLALLVYFIAFGGGITLSIWLTLRYG